MCSVLLGRMHCCNLCSISTMEQMPSRQFSVLVLEWVLSCEASTEASRLTQGYTSSKEAVIKAKQTAPLVAIVQGLQQFKLLKQLPVSSAVNSKNFVVSTTRHSALFFHSKCIELSPFIRHVLCCVDVVRHLSWHLSSIKPINNQ